MKKILGLLLALCLLLGCCSALAEEPAAAKLEKDLVIIYTSDVHCGLERWWGYAGLTAFKEKLSQDHHVLLVDDGDALQGEPVGTMTTGEAIIDIMNEVGYDIAIPGNHDFDYGMDRFLELTGKAKFPYISCNFNKEGKLVFDPYIIKEIDGVKIAFVGVTTPMTLRSSTPKYFMDESGKFIYGFMEDETGEALYAAVQSAVDAARAEGADYVFLMAHLGTQAECSPWMVTEVIANTTGIDAVLDGHSHDEEQFTCKNKDGKDIPRTACGTKLMDVGFVVLAKDGSISTSLSSWNADLSATKLFDVDNIGSRAVAAATSSLNEKLSEVVAQNTVDLAFNDPTALTDEGKPIRIIRRTETNLGDLCADAYLDQAGDADIAFVNGGGIRTSLPKGDVTLNDILTIHPFGNMLTVIEVKGSVVLDALEWSVHSLPGEFGGFNQVAGLTFEYDASIPSPCVEDDHKMFDHVDDSMERRVRNVKVKGEPLDPEKTYKVASHDYQLLNEGDGYTMYKGAKVLQESVKLDNQVLIDYITGTLGGVIGEQYAYPYGDGRIVSVTPEQ